MCRLTHRKPPPCGPPAGSFKRAADARFVRDEFDAFLQCGILTPGFLRPRCGQCGHDKLLAFSCKRQGFCPNCGGGRLPNQDNVKRRHQLLAHHDAAARSPGLSKSC